MFRPYRKPAKLSLKRARLSCMSCSCTKFCSRSAMASLSSANPSCRPSSALDEAALRERWALSRRELRDEGRSGVVGRERGERERRRWERDEGGSWVGVVDAIVLVCVCGHDEGPARVRGAMSIVAVVVLVCLRVSY